MDGFTDVLLPTDRWPWSDVTGMMSLPLHSFLLPSLSWEWEGDWYVDQSCGGDPAETGVSRQHKRLDLTAQTPGLDITSMSVGTKGAEVAAAPPADSTRI